MGNLNLTPFGQEKKMDEKELKASEKAEWKASERAACPPGCQKIPETSTGTSPSSAEKFQGIDSSNSYQILHYSPRGGLYKRRTSRGHRETKIRAYNSQTRWLWILIAIILVLSGYWAWKKYQS